MPDRHYGARESDTAQDPGAGGCHIGNGTTKRSVTVGTQRAATVLRAIGITDLDPPTPPTPGQTVM